MIPTLLVLCATARAAAQPDFSGLPCRDPSLRPSEYLDEHLVYFDHGSALVPDDARTRMVLDSAACQLKLRPGRVTVTAHADTSGDPAANVRLSKRRAEAVAGALARRGVARSTVTLEPSGESRPAVATGDTVAEALNRRAVISWTP